MKDGTHNYHPIFKNFVRNLLWNFYNSQRLAFLAVSGLLASLADLSSSAILTGLLKLTPVSSTSGGKWRMDPFTPPFSALRHV